MSGIEVERLPDGTVRIVATANGGTVKLRVTADFARKLAAKLMVAATGSDAVSLPEAKSWAERIVEAMRKGG